MAESLDGGVVKDQFVSPIEAEIVAPNRSS